jgi:hypothetical protein
MTNDERYAQRAEREMLAVSHFSDWNPSHFLDVGEMVMALSIAYAPRIRFIIIMKRII